MENVATKIERARKAQREWEKASQRRIDDVVRQIAKTVYDNAELLANLTVEETQVGNYEDNVRQDKRKAAIIWHGLKGKKSVGVIRRDRETGLVEIAKPVGVVGAALPVTIPVTNFMSNAMFALKARNAVICAPHPKAIRTTEKTAELIFDALRPFDVPEDLIQYLENPSIEMTRELMAVVDVVVATGGMGVVKSAYSSGRPAYGVGPGNVQCIIDRDVDLERAIAMIVEGRVFNNGLPCACEQAVFVHREDAPEAIRLFQKHRTAIIEEPTQAETLLNLIFVDGALNRECVGAPALALARRAGIPVPPDTRVLMLKADSCRENPFVKKEKLCPVIVLYLYDTLDEVVKTARANLQVDGRGHSVGIHSENPGNIEKFAEAMDVSRVIVNQCCTTSAGGSFHNGFGATTTLGCGIWGNNITSENLSYRHLMNITRIGYPLRDVVVPSDEEIWSD